ncbi:MAG: 4Fe-4S binding protein [Candidatus Muiribacteriaceae bacterium]
MRRLIQFVMFFIINPVLPNYFKGTIYQGPLKSFCVPALNCWSCPAATYSCPIGAIQNSVSYFKYHISLYTISILGLTVFFTGRLFCSFACPFGLLQDLIHKIPSKKTKIFKPKWKYSKFVILVIFVFILPFLTKDPWFSKICPAGFYLASLPLIAGDRSILDNISYFFYIKLFLSSVFFVAAVRISRPFCQYVCPVGAIFELMRPWSLLKIKVNNDTCISCDLCMKTCPMDIPIYKTTRDCIQCGNCVKACPNGSIKIEHKLIKKKEAEVL